MSGFVQGIVGAGLCAVAYAAGVSAGSKGKAAEIAFPDRIHIQHDGIPPEKVACLEWVSDHFDKVNVGQLAMICSGAKL